jgi:hypothetical protein
MLSNWKNTVYGCSVVMTQKGQIACHCLLTSPFQIRQASRLFKFTDVNYVFFLDFISSQRF